jgi:hypothetical protein
MTMGPLFIIKFNTPVANERQRGQIWISTSPESVSLQNEPAEILSIKI